MRDPALAASELTLSRFSASAHWQETTLGALGNVVRDASEALMASQGVTVSWTDVASTLADVAVA